MQNTGDNDYQNKRGNDKKPLKQGDVDTRTFWDE